MSTPALSLSRRGTMSQFARATFELAKPRVTLTVLLTGLAGAGMASRAMPGALDAGLLLRSLGAIALLVAGANALNMLLEQDSDARMSRTRTRPLPTGRLSPDTALWLGMLWALTGLTLLSFTVNPLTGLLGAVALILYVLVYTPLKAVTPWALPVGAIPGAMPPLLGWTSVAGDVSLRGALLFAILFAWQIPHFHAIAIARRDDYERAGFRPLSVARGIPRAALHMVVTSVVLAVVVVGATSVLRPGAVWVAAALSGVSVALAAPALRGGEHTLRAARKTFLWSLLFIVSLMLVLFGIP